MQVDLQKRFPIYRVCPKCLAALLCGTAIRKNMPQHSFRYWMRCE